MCFTAEPLGYPRPRRARPRALRGLPGDPLCVGLVSAWQNAKGVAVRTAPDGHVLMPQTNVTGK
jgi:hypothetical protein